MMALPEGQKLYTCVLMCAVFSTVLGLEFNKTSCGTTKSCLDGIVFLSWQNDAVGETVFFEMSGESDGYIAMGLSLDSKMGSDSVTECVMETDGTVSLYQSHNNGKSNNRITPTETGLTEIITEADGGVISCSFRRAHNVQDDNVFDIAGAQHYYLLTATGSASAGVLGYHVATKSASDQAIDLSSNPQVVEEGAQANTAMYKAHACVMVSAWMLCASIAVVLARYYKAAWPDKTIFNLKVWFQLHRGLMITVLLLHIVGIVVVFVEVNGYTEDGGDTLMKVHPILGLIVTGLVIANPAMALFRCAPDSANRPIFNWCHFLVGMTAHVLAVITIFLGMKADRTRFFMPEWVFWVTIAFVVCHMITEIVLEINRCSVSARGKNEMEMTQDGRATSQANPAQNNMLSYIVLAIYVTIATVLWLTVVIAIALE